VPVQRHQRRRRGEGGRGGAFGKRENFWSERRERANSLFVERKLNLIIGV